MRRVINLALDGLTSAHSRRMYRIALDDFLNWRLEHGSPSITKALVQQYRSYLQAKHLAPSTINQRLSAVRKLVREAADNDLVEPAIANSIARVPGVTSQGVRAGNWLSREQAQALLNAPGLTTLKGLRDRAILAVMLGAGLRRSEVAALAIEHVQQRDGRWVIADLVGKGNRVRTVPIAPWVKAALDAWTAAAAIASGIVFRAVHKGDWVNGAGMTPQAVHDVVREHAGAIGVGVAAHDLRRTYAKLAHRGGSGLDQIQLSLGHASIKTTERYLGVQQDLTDAPGDHLGLRL